MDGVLFGGFTGELGDFTLFLCKTFASVDTQVGLTYFYVTI